MSRKHFIPVANDIKITLNSLTPAQKKGAIALVKDVIIPMMYTSNSSFDKQRFLTACGLN